MFPSLPISQAASFVFYLLRPSITVLMIMLRKEINDKNNIYGN